MTPATSPAVSNSPPAAAPVIVPAPRIEALDVVRGFALIGITLMNIEFFNRPIHSMGSGMATGLTGIDWLAGFAIAYLVQGKFWTIFSTLFGMGFAVMLSRAERDGRNFIPTYLRRILGLAVFGAAHYIFLWDGDILFSYAVGACALMLLLFAKWKPFLIGLVAVVALGFIPGLDMFKGVAGGMAYVGLLSLYLRNELMVRIGSRDVPLFSLIIALLGLVALVAAIALWTIPGAPKGPRFPATIAAVMLLPLSYLSARYRGPAPLRALRLGVTGFVVPAIVGTLFGAVQYCMPAPAPKPAAAPVAFNIDAATSPAVTPSAASAPAAAAGTASGGTAVAGSAVAGSAVAGSAVAGSAVAGSAAGGSAVAVSAPAVTAAAASPRPSSPAALPLSPAAKAAAAERADAENYAKEQRERAERVAERKKEIAEETRILTRGSYLDTVIMRAAAFPQKAANDAGFATVILAMFVLGTWFVRSGVMENTKAHLPLFRKLALIGLPLGIGLGLAGSLIATSSTPGATQDGFNLARGLTSLGNLPACLGYIGLVVVMLHSDSVFSKVRLLAPFGRMALTNYLLQSLVCSRVFYGYGLGHYGLTRAAQVVFVLSLVAVQIVFSHWWMARFRYGPMEWLWRGFTYRTAPQMRL